MATPAEVARYLQVPVKTIYRWRYAGEGPPAYRVGRHLRFRWSDVEGWLAGRGTDHGTPRENAGKRSQLGGTMPRCEPGHRQLRGRHEG